MSQHDSDDLDAMANDIVSLIRTGCMLIAVISGGLVAGFVVWQLLKVLAP